MPYANLLNYSLSYPKSRDAIASKYINLDTWVWSDVIIPGIDYQPCPIAPPTSTQNCTIQGVQLYNNKNHVSSRNVFTMSHLQTCIVS